MIHKNFFIVTPLCFSLSLIAIQAPKAIETISKRIPDVRSVAKTDRLKSVDNDVSVAIFGAVIFTGNSQPGTNIQQLVSGTITPVKQTIKYNTTATSLIATVASGGGGSYRYQWQSSFDAKTWLVISGATNLVYSPGFVKVTSYYRLISISNGISVTSGVSTVTVE